MPTQRPRLLIFVIAYYAEATLKRVLERIPGNIFDTYECEILVVDDASKDRTFEIGQKYKAAHPDIQMTVLRNELNQGYGGNQKVGYSYAIKEGFDFVAMVHGDGQYAPEELPKLVEPLKRGDADAVFGSRMLTPFGALKGGMPLYKYVGNKILTTAQNALLRTRLSEFHSGYRIYSVNTLKRIQFDLNSNDFHFDTEIIIQLLNARARIAELPIPTYYGDEICRVNGMKYAKDVMLATLRNTAHRSGLLFDRKLQPKDGDNQHYTLKLGYASSHTYALEAVPPGAKVLDIGSGPALMAQKLVEKGCETAVVDQFAPASIDRRIRVFQQDLDAPLQVDVRPYEVVLLLDVLEHLNSPEQFLADLRSKFDYQPRKVIVTAPNIAFFVQRLMLLLGQFNHGQAGILDYTHRRHFTFRSLRQLLEDSGIRVRRVRGIPAPFPKVLGDGWAGRGMVALNRMLIAVSKTLFSYQIFIEGEATPNVWFVLGDSKERASAPGKIVASVRQSARSRSGSN